MMESLEKLFIRPARHVYTSKDLGPLRMMVGDQEVHRTDITLRNKHRRKIQLSYYLFGELSQAEEIVVYLHCNSGSRVEGIAHARQVLEAGYAFVVFDFSGSGLSEGEYVTLGLNESEDLETVIAHIRGVSPQARIVLWGRSMGAVATLLYLYKHQEEISIAVFDSPFYSLKELALHIGNNQTSLPKFMLDGFLRLLNNHLKDKTKLDMFSRLNMENIVDSISVPGLFVGSKCDTLVPFKHIQSLYATYAGYKQIFYLDQDHHERRTSDTVNFILKFIGKHLHAPKLHRKAVSNISGLYLNKAKHSVSQLDFRCSLEPCRKIELITKSARRKENIEPKPHKEYFAKGKEQEKKKFINLTDKAGSAHINQPEMRQQYASESCKMIRNETEIFRQSNVEKREPIRLCKRIKHKDERTPLRDITHN